MGTWIDYSTRIPMNEENFQKILEFYLLNCPIKNKKGNSYDDISKRGGQYDNKCLLTSFTSQVSKQITYPNIYKEVGEISELEYDKFEEEYEGNDKNFALVIYKEKSGFGKGRSILYSIRCALAHGSFEVFKDSNGRNVYKFENNYKGKITARIRLRESELIEWMEFIKNYSPTSRKKKQLKRGKQKMLATT